MERATFPSTLKPSGAEVHIVDGKEVRIPTKRLTFKQWSGSSIKNTFGNKGLVDYEGVPMFAELAIQRLAVEGGWDARWVETYAMKGKVPYYFSEWGDGLLSQQVQDPIVDLSPTELLKTVAKNNHNSYSGCWDVVAWKGSRTIFIESKRNKKDRFKPTQDRWLHAGLGSGLSANNFLVAVWDFE